MTRNQEIRLSRQGLLQSKSQSRSESPSPSRQSPTSESERSEDSEDDSELDDKPPIPYQSGRKWPWVPNFQRVLSFGSSRTPSQQNPPPPAYASRTSRTKHWCWKHKICLIVTAILFGGLLTLLTGGALFIWKTAAKDGVSHDEF